MQIVQVWTIDLKGYPMEKNRYQFNIYEINRSYNNRKHHTFVTTEL